MERCELCALWLATEHPHLFDRQQRVIVCTCDACATLFDVIEARRYRRIRPFVRRLSATTVDEGLWTSIGVPVGLAFLSRAPGGEVVAACPGPGGAAVALVSPGAWAALVARHPELADLEPEVEAWLVNRLSSEPRVYRVSIDHCYRLTGLVRSRWTGISGGPGVAEAIDEFFRALEAQAA